MSDWQPIETAPKDGDFIIVGRGTTKTKRGFVVAAVGEAFWDGVGWLAGCTEPECPAHGYWISPTHWMPLPDPPE